MIARGEALDLLCMYHLLLLPICSLPMPSLQGYDSLQARSSLLDPPHRMAPVVLTLLPILELEPTDEDHLQFSTILPHHDQGVYNEEGVCLTHWE